jgi:hypothetical protein
MESKFNTKKQLLGCLYGATAGLVFALAAWGIDAFLLAQSNVKHPLINFAPAFVIFTSVGILIGWLSVKIDKSWLSLTLWLGFGILCTWMITWLPAHGSALILRNIEPELADLIKFPELDSLGQLWFFGLFVIALPSLIAGLMEGILVEQALASSSKGGLLFMLMATVLFFGVAGKAGDHLVNEKFREATLVTDSLIQFASENYGLEVDKDLARKIHLSALNEIEDLVLRPYKITMIEYEQTLGRIELLVDFDGDLAICTVFYAQPVRCRPFINKNFQMPSQRLTYPDNIFFKDVIANTKNVVI